MSDEYIPIKRDLTDTADRIDRGIADLERERDEARTEGNPGRASWKQAAIDEAARWSAQIRNKVDNDPPGPVDPDYFKQAQQVANAANCSGILIDSRPMAERYAAEANAFSNPADVESWNEGTHPTQEAAKEIEASGSFGRIAGEIDGIEQVPFWRLGASAGEHDAAETCASDRRILTESADRNASLYDDPRSAAKLRAEVEAKAEQGVYDEDLAWKMRTAEQREEQANNQQEAGPVSDDIDWAQVEESAGREISAEERNELEMEGIKARSDALVNSAVHVESNHEWTKSEIEEAAADGEGVQERWDRQQAEMDKWEATQAADDAATSYDDETWTSEPEPATPSWVVTSDDGEQFENWGAKQQAYTNQYDAETGLPGSAPYGTPEAAAEEVEIAREEKWPAASASNTGYYVDGLGFGVEEYGFGGYQGYPGAAGTYLKPKSQAADYGDYAAS